MRALSFQRLTRVVQCADVEPLHWLDVCPPVFAALESLSGREWMASAEFWPDVSTRTCRAAVVEGAPIEQAVQQWNALEREEETARLLSQQERMTSASAWRQTAGSGSLVYNVREQKLKTTNRRSAETGTLALPLFANRQEIELDTSGRRQGRAFRWNMPLW
ncbi:MAG TPA: hypothetical protein VF573_13440 [Paraburkholderia sp.]|uniref:hypothetical protein n=1 Tax=Paraburkholderia sp. TaxID=1926495 RepID=UPI002ED18D12